MFGKKASAGHHQLIEFMTVQPNIAINSEWTKPPPQVVKINCDASPKGKNREARVSAIAKNSNGVVGGTNALTHESTALAAEA
ncbi:hypothetical protein PVK06_004359 [Gossypium arboreum]|uniref:Uncharacterized protein n=1 Tax=Gossypium arboreum TaxID=29729 RepID=A0ABR0QT18_GOSAR|nr:hypothetical protein PVK06_004359 [Gossypium arboreum]